jgi:hypothetical protein
MSSLAKARSGLLFRDPTEEWLEKQQSSWFSDLSAMTCSKHGQRSSSPVQDLISSIILGAILGTTFHVLDSATGPSGHVTRRMGIPHIGGRIGVLQFVILSGVVGL